MELLLTIAIAVILAAIITRVSGIYLQRGRDQARKSELAQIQQALALYHNDFSQYPCTTAGSRFIGNLSGCGLSTSYITIPHDERAPLNNCSAQFSDYAYFVTADFQDYQLYARLETVSSLPYQNVIGTCDYNYRVENP